MLVQTGMKCLKCFFSADAAARSFKMVGKANKTRYGDQLQSAKTLLTFLSI